METIRVVDWSTLYENHRTRELKRMEWIPVPNRMDGDGYTELVDDPNGAAHLGVWLCILQIASKCDPRGTLVRGIGIAHTPRSIARISRLPAQLCEEAIKRLLGLGWLEFLDAKSQSSNDIQETVDSPRISGGNLAVSREPARQVDYGMEGNGMEGNERNGSEARAVAGGAIPADRFFEERYAIHPKKKHRVLAEQALCQIIGIETATVQEKFRAGHDAWIGTDDYQWKGGAKCPTLAEFITDRTWEYLPHAPVVSTNGVPGPYVPYRPPDNNDYESYDDLLARARKSAINNPSTVVGYSPYAPYKPPV